MDVTKSGTRKEELLVEPDILRKMYVLRRILNPMGTVDADGVPHGQAAADQDEFGLLRFDEHLDATAAMLDGDTIVALSSRRPLPLPAWR